ncbi:hypothetical protein [Actinoplanes sp. NBRC 101535]|uniref:hypothetical protein n=1 Tax=Actinoplanes sp. NBRC 101535 TaxID=3032196 RepID=UPI0024A4D64A|nr:hypothetical protein [Actinoplanes sp. NBRC 101535]GLY04266.1 hypothetical protein Acsp01_46450 [Actinoplanes sp. NBRC 101535]
MSDFRMSGYQPRWLQGYDAVVAQHGQRLAGLAGRTLRHVWLTWDSDDTWVSDWPVLLDFGTDQVEINHYKTDDVSITFSSIDPSRPIDSDYGFVWRRDALRQLQALAGQQLRHARVLEPADNRGSDEPLAIAFTFVAGYLAIYNHRDDNGLLFEPDKEWRER